MKIRVGYELIYDFPKSTPVMALMGARFLRSEAVSRGARMLRTALGPAITARLEDPAVIEIMLNPDSRIWIDRLTDGLADTGRWLAPADGERIIRLVAHHVGAEVHASTPRVSAELPETGERFENLLPPVVAAPAFAIRKPAVAERISQPDDGRARCKGSRAWDPRNDFSQWRVRRGRCASRPNRCKPRSGPCGWRSLARITTA
jgi:hypothetical protein